MDPEDLNRTQINARKRVGPSTRLIVFPQDKPKEEYDLEKDEVVIGRALHCDIVLADASVSREHVRLRYEGGTYFLKDLGSTNGVRINGEVSRSGHLRDEDSVQIGQVLCKFVIGGKKKEVASESKGVKVIRRDSTTMDRIRLRLGSGTSSDGSRKRLVVIGGVATLLVLFVLAGRGRKPKPTDEAPTPPAVMAAPQPTVAQDTLGEPEATKPVVEPTAASAPSRPTEPMTIADMTEETRRKKLVAAGYEEAVAAMATADTAAGSASKESEIAAARNLLSEARLKFKEVLRLAPDHAEAKAEEARIAQIDERLQQRLESLRAAFQQRVDDAYAVASAQLSAGNYSAAVASFDEVLKLQANHAGAKKGRADAVAAQGRVASQRRQVATARELLATLQKHLKDGQAAAAAGRPATALDHYQRCTETIAQIEDLDLAGSSEERTQAAAIDRAVREHRNRLQEEVQRIQTEARDEYGRGVTYQSLGRVDEARAAWLKVLEITRDPNEEYHVKAKAKLRQIGHPVD